MSNKFKVGDRVEGISFLTKSHIKGKIIKVDDSKIPYLVRFELGENTDDWWCKEKDLKLISKKKKVKKKDYKYIVLSFGQDYDRVVDIWHEEHKAEAQRAYLEANFSDYAFGIIKKVIK